MTVGRTTHRNATYGPSQLGGRAATLDSMSSRTQPRERGAILIITSVGMVAMMCFAGLAVDVGLVRSQRAQYQATADAAAIYATYLIRQPGANVDTVAAQVRAFVGQNLDINATADNTWRNCDDPRPLATRSTRDIGINNECITFLTTPGLPAQARVRLPIRQTRPIIGLGVLTMEVTAVAGAEGSGGCDVFALGGCGTTTTTTSTTTTRVPTTTTWAPSTTAPPRTTTSWAPPTSTTIPRTTTTRPRTTTTRPRTTTTVPRSTTTRPRTTTTVPRTTTTARPTTTTTPVTTTTEFIDIGV